MRLSCVFALGLAATTLSLGTDSAAALDVQHNVHHARSSSHRLHAGVRTASASRRLHAATPTFRHATLMHRRHRFYEHFTASSFAKGDIFGPDVPAGEDPIVRQAAIDALAGMNGPAVAIDPSNGRILAMVNQHLALSPGAEP